MMIEREIGRVRAGTKVAVIHSVHQILSFETVISQEQKVAVGKSIHEESMPFIFFYCVLEFDQPDDQ